MSSNQVKQTSTKRSKSKSKKSSSKASQSQVNELEQQMETVEQNLNNVESTSTKKKKTKSKTKKSKKTKKAEAQAAEAQAAEAQAAEAQAAQEQAAEAQAAEAQAAEAQAAEAQAAEAQAAEAQAAEAQAAEAQAAEAQTNSVFEETRQGVTSAFEQANSAFGSILEHARVFHDNATSRDYRELRQSYNTTYRLLSRINQTYQDYLLKHCQTEEKRALKKKSKDRKRVTNMNSGIAQQHPLHPNMIDFLNSYEQQRASQSGGEHEARTYTDADTMSRVDALKAINGYIKLMVLQEWPEDGRRFAVKHALQPIFGPDRTEMVFTDIMGGLGPYFPSSKKK